METVVALPVLLLLTLGLFQLALLYQTRLALDQAVVEAARSGSTGNAQDEALQRGLARGLAPMLYGAEDALELQANEARALGRVAIGLADGSIVLTRESPTAAAFSDWEVPALDAYGEPIPGVVEIPNDNLDVRRIRSTPRSGVRGYRGDEPIGAGSGLTLVDANVLRIGLVYAAPLTVPLAGKSIAAVLRGWYGCGGGAAGGSGGRFGGGVSGGGVGGGNVCAQLEARPPRLPLRTAASVRMMSPPRRVAGEGAATPAPGAAAGPTGPAVPPGGAMPAVAATDEPAFTGPTAQASPVSRPVGRADSSSPGFLSIGSDRTYPSPGLAHPALCDDRAATAADERRPPGATPSVAGGGDGPVERGGG